MPKKTRKMKQRAAMRRSVGVAQSQENDEVAGASAGEPLAPSRVLLSSARPMTPLTFDYTHIYSDLKRIAVFASFFFIVLIALSFVIK